MKSREKLLTLKNFYGPGYDLDPIKIPDVTLEEHHYNKNDMEGFQYVFTKDNMPTYHQLHDNFLHWIWNEYDNDPNKYASDKYKSMVLDKVFTWINARILGVINNGDNHPEILEFLDQVVGFDMTALAAIRAAKLRNRAEPFTKDDAIIWWDLQDRAYAGNNWPGLKEKPLILPSVHIPHVDTIYMNDHFDEFYRIVFKYVLKYYQHVYGAKFKSQWVEVDEKDYFHIEEISFPMTESPELGPFFFNTMLKMDALEIVEGGKAFVFIGSENGDMLNCHMDTYTMAHVAKCDGRYYISSMRGFDVFRQGETFVFDSIPALGIPAPEIWSKQWIDTLTAKGKNNEAIRTGMWRDVMECGAVLFPIKEFNVLIKFRITNQSRYEEQLAELLQQYEFTDKGEMNFLTHLEGSDNRMFEIRNMYMILNLWTIFEHTLDLWIKYRDKWSLICNISTKDYSFYRNNPHIDFTHYDAYRSNINDLEGLCVSIIPRDGMSWDMISIQTELSWDNDNSRKQIYQ